MPGPLDGIRIVDLTQMVAGPVATMILADQGADVIKVEPPRGGDYTRQVSTRRHNIAASFLNNNRNKRSIALNLKEARGVEIVKDLARNADVFVQNFRPGVADRLGVGEAAIRVVAPEIVYVSISGFGEEGPWAHKPVYDPLVQALTGLTTVQAGSDEVRPRLVRTILPDKLTGITASQAITAALLSKARTGKGQHVKLSMLDSIVAFLWHSDMNGLTFVKDEIQPERAQSFLDLIYETKDGYISVAVQNDRQWLGLTRALEKPEWLDDPRFKTAALRHHNIDDRLNLTQEALLTRPAAEWIDRLEAEDVPCAPVLKRHEMLLHPQVQASGIVTETDHPHAGRLRQARPAAQFSQTAPEYRHGGALLGEHTAEILAEMGLADKAIAELIDSGIAGPHQEEAG